MTPVINMPILRQLPRNTDKNLFRALFAWREPIVYEVIEHYVYTAWIDGKPEKILIPAGFRSDLASTPAFSWCLGFRPDAPILLVPGLIHDWYYRHGYLLTDKHETICRNRGKIWADRLLAKITSKMAGVKTPGMLAFIALYLFGWPAWMHNKQYRDEAEKTGTVQLKGDYT